jgi:hypothetical protein
MLDLHRTPRVTIGWCGYAITLVLSVSAMAQPPRTLPTPEVPLRNATEGVPYSGAPQSSGAELYLGPPAGIDGPEELPEIEAAPPGVEVGEAPLLEDLFDGTLLAGRPKLNPYKDGFFQKLSLAAAWMGNSSDPADLGLTEIDTFVQVGVPAPIIQWPLLITPGFNLTLIDGPTVTDLPPRLYYTYVDFMWLPQVVRGYTLLLSVVPGVFGDFEAHQFRWTGKGLVIIDWIPDRLQFVGGVLYLNRDNVRLLPAGGLIWTPADWMRLELIFPKPKVGVRVNGDLGYEDWVYGTAEFGGNTWPIIREGDFQDNVTYNDYRLLIGFERKLQGGAGYRLEAGYVFGRTIRFSSERGDFDPQDTFLFRGGITF